jgi:hypothetical protein
VAAGKVPYNAVNEAESQFEPTSTKVASNTSNLSGPPLALFRMT